MKDEDGQDEDEEIDKELTEEEKKDRKLLSFNYIYSTY